MSFKKQDKITIVSFIQTYGYDNNNKFISHTATKLIKLTEIKQNITKKVSKYINLSKKIHICNICQKSSHSQTLSW
jgi:hypothetical protein